MKKIYLALRFPAVLPEGVFNDMKMALLCGC
jgi:hypothetical protein